MLGVDALGLVFYEQSPRYVSVSEAQEIIRVIPPFVTKVGLFLDATPNEVRAVINRVTLDCLQFHGTESAHYCESFDKPYIKSVAMLDLVSFDEYVNRYSSASAFLLDAVKTGEAGGKGQTFAWDKVPRKCSRPLILAGGLNSQNVATAIKSTGCYAVDVSSGVESEKGKKSKERMIDFITQVKQADGSIK